MVRVFREENGDGVGRGWSEIVGGQSDIRVRAFETWKRKE